MVLTSEPEELQAPFSTDFPPNSWESQDCVHVRLRQDPFQLWLAYKGPSLGIWARQAPLQRA